MDAVLFDLDDTIFPQSAWLSGAWQAVAAAAPNDVDRDSFHTALVEIAAEGSDRGRIIDRALERIGSPGCEIGPLMEAFRSHAPRYLAPYAGAVAGLQRLRTRVPIGLVTDGDVGIQQAKLAALGLDDAFDVVVMSDRLGRQHRKPDPAPFLAALEDLGVEPGRAVHVGDRPDKDVAGAVGAGLRAIRVRTGEYSTHACPEAVWAEFADLESAADFLVSRTGRLAG